MSTALATGLAAGAAWAVDVTTAGGSQGPHLAQLTQAQTFDISAQPLEGALRAFAAATGWTLDYPAALAAGQASPGFRGTGTPTEVLTALLAGTDLIVATATDRSATLIAVAVPAAPGVAQLPTLRVTARRIEEDLKDVPVAARVFSSEDLEKSNIQSVEDYIEFTPNIATTNSGRKARNDISIRGVGNLIGENATADSIGFYIDGVNTNPTGGQRGINQSLLDLERVEVLYGPQGTSFGRNTIGGLVNFVTKKPTAVPEYSVSTGLANNETRSVRLTANGSLTGDENLMARAAVIYNDTAGFVENSTEGVGSIDEEEYGVRVALRSLAMEGVVYDLTVSHSVTKDGGFNGIALDDFNAARISGDDYRTGDNFQADNSTGHTNVVQAVEVDLDFARLTSNTGYVFTRDREIGDRDYNASDSLERTQARDLFGYSQEFRLEADRQEWNFLPGKVSWTVGGIGSRDGSDDKQEFYVGEDVLSGAVNDEFGESTQEVRIWSGAGFGEIRYEPTENWELSIGGRFTWDEVETTVEITNTNALLNDIFPPTEKATFTETFSAFTPKISARYKITEEASVFAAVGQGYKTGGFNTNGTAFDDESITTYETGVKVDMLEGRLQGSATAFFSDWEDVQLRVDNAALGITQIENAGKAETYGAEVGFQFRPIDALTIAANYGYLQSEIKEFDFTPASVGRDLPRAPHHTFSTTAEYIYPIADWVDWRLRGEYSQRSKYITRIGNVASGYDVDGYDLLNLRTGFDTENVSFEFYVENVMDERYILDSRGATPILNVPESVTVGDRRSFGAKLTVIF